MSEEIEYLNHLSKIIKRVNSKVLLLGLIEKAKKEYDSFNFESGKETLLNALKIDSKNSVVLRGLGCIEQFNGNFQGAIEYFEQALQYSEQKEIEYTLIGMAYYLQDKLDEALYYFNSAIDENDDYTEAFEGRNQTLLEYHLKITDLQESLESIIKR